MGQAHPFSNFDDYLNDKHNIQGCIVDTQFLVAILYELHSFHQDSVFLFKKLVKYQVPIFATVTTRSEFIDIQRRILITEALMGMISPSSSWENSVAGKKETIDNDWRLTNAVKNELRKHKAWIDGQASKENMPILTDNRIKQCKDIFFPKKQSGKSGWLEICDHFLSGELTKQWNNLVNLVGINYLDMNDPDIQEYFHSKVSWNKMCEISEQSCIGSSDAMILNMINSSSFPVLISADYDMAYSISIDKKSSTDIFIPNNLYRNKINKLKL